ncbi:haloacid dehalogenase [Spirochaetia bacterium]|nr:haloacid dehalogenase [Spirochaetia bacterium]
MGISAVVFDYGKVICFPPAEGFEERLAAIAGIQALDLAEIMWKHREEYDRGTIDGKEYYRTMLESKNIHPDDKTLEKIVQTDLDNWKNINPGTEKLMDDVKKAGLKLGILSNMPHDFLKFARDHFPVFSLPQVGIFSCEYRSIKPEKKIYEILLEALDCPAGEVVFFDDMESNVQAAKDLGLRALLWKDPESARQELRNLGVPV